LRQSPALLIGRRQILAVPKKLQEALILTINSSERPQLEEDDRPGSQRKEQQEHEDSFGDDPGLENEAICVHV